MAGRVAGLLPLDQVRFLAAHLELQLKKKRLPVIQAVPTPLRMLIILSFADFRFLRRTKPSIGLKLPKS